jgi:sigma-B regulation protein RsbU (phosphoserine phosphatase)
MRPVPSPVSSPSSPGPSGPTAPGPSWEELTALAHDEANDRPFLLRLLELWAAAHGATAAALYLTNGGLLEIEGSAGSYNFPDEIVPGAPAAGFTVVPIPGGALLGALPPSPPSDIATAAPGGVHEPLTLLLTTAAKGCLLKRRLKEQHFQVNYRGVELEALYDVGLAVAATLDLEQLSEEILLRAVSLLDARRGALYLLEGDRYHATRTFGGEAGLGFVLDDPALATFLAGEGEPPTALLPGVRHHLGVPIAIEQSPRGFLAVGDKESRRGVGPFPDGDRRTLGLFANQAAIALENARLHRQALEKERLERELTLAAEIQRQILPKGAPEVAGYQLVGWNRPARQVGGDYYDLLPRGDGRVSLAVGDVSGKGMPAALMVSTLHSALRLLLDRTGLGPAFLERLNAHILESSAANKFITLFLAELEPESGTVHYLNAGHNPGLLLRQGGAVEELGSGGLPIGLLPGSRYEKRTVSVEPGDLLCLYTDGITECADPTDEEFGIQRLLALLAEHRGHPLQSLLDRIDRAMIEFAAGQPQLDDQTVLLLRRDD